MTAEPHHEPKKDEPPPACMGQKGGTRVTARGDRVTIADAALLIPDGMLVHGISGPKTTNHTPIRLKLLLSKDDLSRLTYLFMINRNVFCHVFFEAMVRPSIPPPRKRQGGQGSYKVEHASTLWQKRILNIPDGLRVQGINGFKSENHPPIELKTHLGTDDLARLIFVFNSSRDALCDAFFEAVILPSIEYLRKRKSGRGLNKGKEVSLRWLKREASQLYFLFKALLELGRRPPFFIRLINEIKAHPRKDDFYRDGKQQTIENLNPVVLSAYCVEKYRCRSGTCLPSLGVTSFMEKIESLPNAYDDDTRSPFYKNYIYNKSTFSTKMDALDNEEKERTAEEEARIENEIESSVMNEGPLGVVFGWIFSKETAPCPQEGSACSSRFLRS